MPNDSEILSAPSSTLPRSDLLRRMHSVTGMLPVGGFLLLHLWTNLHALRGQQSFDAVVATAHRFPFALWFEILGIYVPLSFHAIYGVRLSFTALPKFEVHPDAKSWADILQRITGLIALIFIVAHFWQFRLQVFLGRMDRVDFFSEACSSLSSTNGLGVPLIAFGYLIGIAACAFHFANGLVSFCSSWGLTVSEKARRWTILLSAALGIGLFLVGAMITLYFATGSALLVRSDRSHGDRAIAWCTTVASPLEEVTTAAKSVFKGARRV